MQNKYDESMATLTDLLDAQTQWQQARSNMIEATHNIRFIRPHGSGQLGVCKQSIKKRIG